MEFSEVAGFLRKCGYSEGEINETHRVFYEFGKMDFLYSGCAKKYDVESADGTVTKLTMTQYWFGKTEIKQLNTIDELYDSI